MIVMKNEIDKLICKMINVCDSWIRTENNSTYFIDPIENKEILGHYGASHVAAAFIIYGEENGNKQIFEKGNKLLNSLLNRWDLIKSQPDFHNDFNNFALCLIERYLDRTGHVSNIKRIEEIVLNTLDSSHDTVNWLPMRAYVNYCRYLWTDDMKYRSTYEECLCNIKKATFEDGFIEDRLPKGLSFNLQYDVATVAVMQFIKNLDMDIDISNEFTALMNVVSPDHDINYLGRGTNQIFAWGLWIYLLSSSGDKECLNAVHYLGDRLDSMLNNNNLMLNEWDGHDRYLWWDYHYCSVYTAHLLLWLVLAKKDNNKFQVEKNNKYKFLDSGLNVIGNQNLSLVWFNGRKEYLAEKGPVITNLWLERLGCVCKGTFGPWRGVFGNKYSNDDVIHNYFGLIKVNYNKEISNNRVLRRLGIHINEIDFIKYTPYFLSFDSEVEDKKIFIKWLNQSEEELYLNIPVFVKKREFVNHVKLYVDKVIVPLEGYSMIKNQYDWCLLLKSKICNGKEWILEITD